MYWKPFVTWCWGNTGPWSSVPSLHPGHQGSGLAAALLDPQSLDPSPQARILHSGFFNLDPRAWMQKPAFSGLLTIRKPLDNSSKVHSPWLYITVHHPNCPGLLMWSRHLPTITATAPGVHYILSAIITSTKTSLEIFSFIL